MQAPPLLPIEKLTWADHLLGLDPRQDPRVQAELVHPEELDLLAERMWEEGLDPTPENARPYLQHLRSGLERSLRDTMSRAALQRVIGDLWAQEQERATGGPFP